MSSFSFVEEDFLTEIMSSFTFVFYEIERISDNRAFSKDEKCYRANCGEVNTMENTDLFPLSIPKSK